MAIDRPILLLLVFFSLLSCSKGPGEGTGVPSSPYVEKTVLDFGEVPHGKPVTGEFILVNPEERSLKVIAVRVGCTCAYLSIEVNSPDGKKREVDPFSWKERGFLMILSKGERACLRIRYETKERLPMRERITEFVNIYLDHPRVKRIDCAMKITIVPRIIIKPIKPSFGSIPRSKRGILVVDLIPLKPGQRIKVLGVKGTNGRLSSRILTDSPERVSIEFTVAKGMELGPFVFPVEIRTDVGERYDIPLRLVGNVVPDLTVSPGGTLALGRISGSLARTSAIVSWEKEGEELDPEIKEITGPKGISAWLEEKVKGRKWKLVIQYKRRKGQEKGFFKGSVWIHTKSREYRTYRVRFQGFIE